MGRRTPEGIERERVANRERMRRRREDPAYRAEVNRRRATRDADRRAEDPELVLRLRTNKKRYFDRRKSDPDFWKKRKEYLARWKSERREAEEFEAFMARIETEGDATTEEDA